MGGDRLVVTGDGDAGKAFRGLRSLSSQQERDKARKDSLLILEQNS